MKSITLNIAEALAVKGWNLTESIDSGSGRIFRFHHDEKDGCISIHENKIMGDMVTYVNLEDCPDGYFDLTAGEFVRC